MAKNGYYVVTIGRQTGIFDEETPSARSIHSDVSRLGGVSVIRFR